VFETDAEFYEADETFRLQIEAKAQPRQVERMAVQLDRRDHSLRCLSAR
jgi:hypothetical protein